MRWGSRWKSLILWGYIGYLVGISKETIDKGAWAVSRLKEAAWQKIEGGVFLGGWYPNAHYASYIA